MTAFALVGSGCGLLIEWALRDPPLAAAKVLRYYWFREAELEGIPLVVSRTGWSSELGFEIYLRDASRGDELWERIMDAGKPFGLRAGHTSTIRRMVVTAPAPQT